MSLEDQSNIKKRWYFYLSDRGIGEIYAKLMSLPRLGRVIRLTFILGLCFAGGWLFDVIRQPFAPTDWVEVTVRNVPLDLRQIYLIADGRDGVRALNWYQSMLIVSEADPRRFGQQLSWNRPQNERFATIQWPSARRYGALAQRSDGRWELWWFGPDDLDGPSLTRYLVGGGTAEIWLPGESKAVTPSPELLKQVSLPEKPPG
jgi:hypothetical protein